MEHWQGFQAYGLSGGGAFLIPDWQGLLAFAPLLALAGGAVLLMLLLSIRRSLGSAYALAVLSLLTAAVCALLPLPMGFDEVRVPLLLADAYGGFFAALFCIAGAATAVIAKDYLARRAGQNEEFFLLLLLATLGAATLAYATHLVSFALGLELLGVSLYALIAYPERGALPLEAAVKYLVLSGAASATFLFGFALIYAATGELGFDGIGAAAMQLSAQAQAGAASSAANAAAALAPPASSAALSNAAGHPVLLAGAALVIAGLAFKLSAVPFHLWTPDVYEGAPAPVAGFLAAVSKAAVFAALLRWWQFSDLYYFSGLLAAVAVLAAASMLIGNWLAMRQQNLKRLLAYSSIAHMGYLLIVLAASGAAPGGPELALEAACYYLAAYTAASLAAFSLVGLLSLEDGGDGGALLGGDALHGSGAEEAGAGGALHPSGDVLHFGGAAGGGNGERDRLADVQGLFWRRPGLALLLTVSLLSLAGIPLTAGFIGKFYLVAAGVDAALWLLLAALVIGSGISIYYYLRVIYAMSSPIAESASEPALESEGAGRAADEKAARTANAIPEAPAPAPASRLAYWGLTAAVLFLGTVPGPLSNYLRTLF